MEHVLSLFLLIVAVTCVIVATQPVRPSRPASRRRRHPVLTAPRAAEAAPTTPNATYPWGDTQRWSRRDIQQAIAREHAFPGGETVWPPR